MSMITWTRLKDEDEAVNSEPACDPDESPEVDIGEEDPDDAYIQEVNYCDDFDDKGTDVDNISEDYYEDYCYQKTQEGEFLEKGSVTRRNNQY